MDQSQPNALNGQDEWALRPWILAALLALAGLAIFLVTDDRDDTPAMLAIAAFAFFGSMAAAFSLERDNWLQSAVFSLGAGLVMGGLAYHAVDVGDYVAGEEYCCAAGVFATVLAVPMFQAGFHRTWFATPYRDTHYYVWTDAVAAAGSLAFTGLAWLTMFLLAALFALLKIDFLKDLLDEAWFAWMLSGAAFGASLGVLRNQLKVLGTLQLVVMLVLSIMAVPLAVALVLFFAAVALSGLDVLWVATRSATPLLLSCAAGSFILANGIVRDDDTMMSGNRLLRIAAMVLALGILPLSVFAAVSMGMRVNQHGLSPERIWALVTIAVACAYGLAYLVALVRGRMAGWAGMLRRANFNLAVGVSVLALFLALPILDFGAISAANQLSRLKSGAVSAEDFDYDALRWDFGDAGREALAGLAESGDPKIAELAKEAQEHETRPWRGAISSKPLADRMANVRFEFDDEEVEIVFRAALRRDDWRCEAVCTVVDLGTIKTGARHFALVTGRHVEHFRLNRDGDLSVFYPSLDDQPPAPPAEEASASDPVVEVRPYPGRQIYVDGKPAGGPFP